MPPRIPDHFAAILDGIPGDRIAAIDTRFRYTALNAACREEFRRRFGTDLETGMSVTEPLADFPDEQKRVLQLWTRTLGGESFSVPAVGEAGGISYFFPVHEGGTLAGAASVTRELPDGSRVEEALRQSAADLSRAQAVARTGSWRLDVSHEELLWSDEVYRMFGVPKGTPLSYGAFLARVHPDDRALVDERWKAALGGEPYEVEHRIVVGDQVKWVIERAELEFARDGTLVGGFGTVQDITDRKLAEEALRQHAEALSFLSGTATRLLAPAGRDELFEFVTERICAVAGGAIVTFSEYLVRHRRILIRQLCCRPGEREKLARLLGRDPIGLTFDFPDEARARIVPGELQQLPGGLCEATFGQLPLALCRLAEAELEIGDVYAMACAVGEDILGTVAVLTHERGPLQGKRLIESVVNQAALALKRWRTEETLRESEQALREADQRKNEFLAMLSHELRNPLAPIRNSIYILERAAPGSEQARRAQAVVDRQSQHLTRLTDDLLDVTRVARGKVQLRRERLTLNELVRRTIEDHRAEFVRSRVALEVAVGEQPIPVNGDPTRLEQVVGNLLQNAAKFTPPGGRASVSLAPRGEFAELRVADDGVGIAPEALGRVFEPFVQADTALDRSRGGLGLGLALVKGFVVMHGGSVQAESAGLGKGSVFTVRLPVAPQPPAESAARPASVSEVATGRRVLVIEDNVDAAESLKEALQLSGHDVLVAYDGREGLEMARQHRPCVVLCDLGLPGMDGYAVARALRGDARVGAPYLVALSGYALQEDQDRSREAGFDEHMAKPPNMAALERLLANK